MLRAIHFSPLPFSDLGQGVAISTTAFMLPRFFVRTAHILRLPFELQSLADIVINIIIINIIIPK